MALKYYSDRTEKFYNSEEDCHKAELELDKIEQKQKEAFEAKKKEAEKKSAERKAMAKEVEDARQAMLEARSKYVEELEAFCNKYGTYHTSLTGEDAKRMAPTLFDSIFDGFFNF